jgi:low temperature requirement protein LtrA
MVGRDQDEPHRASTPLELLFDLCFVVGVAEVAAQLHHSEAAGHALEALPGYLVGFFLIWWAWMNFTWFASAYDTDDVPYRLLTLLQIGGVLILTAGVPAAFASYDFTVAVAGYIVMRVAMVIQWLRAAREHPATRRSTLRYAVGIGLCQVGWLIRLALPAPWNALLFAALSATELGIPAWAEASGQPTPWHAGHIAERYGLFTIIVLGECVFAATTAIQAAIARVASRRRCSSPASAACC